MIQIITIHEKDAVDFLQNNGIGVLTDFSLSPKVKETINGEFYLEFEYNYQGKYSNFIVEENIIVAPVGYGERQAFRISKTKKIINDDNIYIYVFAKHISYDLVDNVIEDSYVKNKSGDAAISWILSNTQYEHNFVGSSDISKINNARYVFKNPIQALISDDDNSFINRWGGEIVRDNFNIIMLQRRGKDKGISIRYRKNLKGITFETDYSNIVTRAMITGYDSLKLPEEYVDSKLLNNYINPKISEIKYDDIKLKANPEDEEGFNTLEDCYSEMRNRIAQEYENGLDKPNISATVDFVELSKTEEYKEYKSLEKLGIGDYVHIYIDEFDLDVTEKVISTVYDPIQDKYTSFELGDFFKSYTLENKEYKKQLEESIIPNVLDEAKKNATNLLTTALGGFIVKTRNELFIMDNENMNKATKVWRWNLNGLGYSKNGINGPYELAMTQDGRIVADFITTGQMSVERISGLSNTLSDVTKRIDLLEDGIELAVTKKNIFAAINLGVKEKQGTITLEGNIVSIKSDCFELTPDGKVTATAGNIGGLTLINNKLYKRYQSNGETFESGLSIPDNTSGNSTFIYAGHNISNTSLADANMFIQHNGNIYFRSGSLAMMHEPTLNEDGSASWKNALSFKAEGIWRYLRNGYTWSYEGIDYVDGKENGHSIFLHSAKSFDIIDGVHNKVMSNFIKYNPDEKGGFAEKGHKLLLYADVSIAGQDMAGNPHALYVVGPISTGSSIISEGSITSSSVISATSMYSNGSEVITKAYNPIATTADNDSRKVSYILRLENSGNTTGIIFGFPNAQTYRVTGNTTSDRRLKNNIKETEIESALDIIKKIKHYSFDFKQTKEHKRIGYIAQELEKIDKDFVNVDNYKGQKIKNIRTLNENMMMPYITLAIQELDNKIEKLLQKEKV